MGSVSRLPLSWTWQCANKYTLIDLYKVDKVIIPHHVAFVQSNSDQNIFLYDTMYTNCDIVVNTVLKKPEILPWLSPCVL